MGVLVGVICEFDPFHKGHKRLLDQIRAMYPDCHIVCAMSGVFTQRGEAALLLPRARAQMALLGGADAVVELPCAFSSQGAQCFALGGVSLLASLGCEVLAFGCESGDLDGLWEAAKLLEAQDERLFQRMRPYLDAGESYAKAQGRALAALLGKAYEQPNDVLALCYLRAILKLQAGLTPFAVQRQGDYHAQALGDGYPSATAARAAILAGNDVSDAIPEYSLSPLNQALASGQLCRPDALDRVLLKTLRGMQKNELAALPDCAEGLEARIKALCRTETSREGLLCALKTKRYTYARLSRLMTSAMLGVSRDTLAAIPLATYARLLGFRKQSEGLLTELGKGTIPLIAKAANMARDNLCWQLDERAYDLWALGADLPAGLLYTQGVAIV